MSLDEEGLDSPTDRPTGDQLVLEKLAHYSMDETDEESESGKTAKHKRRQDDNLGGGMVCWNEDNDLKTLRVNQGMSRGFWIGLNN